ncbi:MAG TPA: nuclear transport factor 2 family protein [Pyrinomonadaceae bacterium]|nr:nuclear transport factor 2 family protein [Pyrinomonadaceae bacterium]
MNERLCFVLLLAASVAGCGGSPTNQHASGETASANSANRSGTAAKPTVEEIRQVLAAHDKALNEKNLDAVMNTYSTDGNTVMMGTGAQEHWMGPQEIRAAYTEIFKDYDPGTLQTDCAGWKTGGADDAGTMAWLAATCNARDSLQGKTREYKLNVTGTIAKQNGQWRFVVLHMSNAYEGPVTKSD